MKASVLTKYGSPDYFEFKEVVKPTPKDNEVLVKIQASSINSWDWEILIGKPFVNRLMVGLLKPGKVNILGCDIAGRIEKVGRNIKQFQPGDEVFGDISHCKWGGFAEYVCVSEEANVLALKPANMTFEQAASIPQAAVLALQGLRKGNIQPDQFSQSRRVLINGASGGVGSFAVQMAKSFGAEVTAVCSTQKLDFVRALGADHVIDYTRDDFTKNSARYDLILDVKGSHSIFDYKRVLMPNGGYVMAGGSTALVNQLFLLGPWISLFGKKKMGLLLHKPDAKDLDFVKVLFETGKLEPVIDKCYPLCEVDKAMRYYGEGRTKGKIVISIAQKSGSPVINTGNHYMKAIIYRRYGPPDVLQMREVEKPSPKNHEVLIKVRATTVNRTDCATIRAKPFFMRLVTGLFKPKKQIPGTEFAGEIEAVGKNVSSLEAGDKVFGFDDDGSGSHAQFLAIKEDKVVKMPDTLTYEQAAASSEGAHYAYNFINKVNLKKGQNILVNGATGAIGSAAVQLLKNLQANVTAVCATKNITLVKSLGADNIIDYIEEDFTKDKRKYDLVFDTVGKSSFFKCRHLLKPGGIYISSDLGYMAQNIFLPLITPLIKPLLGHRKTIFPAPTNIRRSLLLIKSLIEQGKFKSVIDRKYPLQDIVEAFKYVEKGQKTGNVVITVGYED